MYTQRVQPWYTGRRIRRAITLWFALSLLGFVVAMGVYGDHLGASGNRVHEQRFNRILLMEAPGENANSPAAIAFREQLGQQLVKESSSAVSNRLNVHGDRYGLTENEIKRVAATGESINLSPTDHVAKVSLYFHWLEWPGIGVDYLILSLALFIAFASATKEATGRLADLPWRKSSTWLLVLLTLPWGVICLAVSALRLRGAAPEVPAPNVPHRYVAPHSEHKDVVIAIVPNSEAHWVELLAHDSVRRVAARIANLKSVIDDIKDDMRGYSASIVSAQQSLAPYKQELKRLEAMTIDDSLATRERLMSEYQQVSKLPSVSHVNVSDNVVSVICRQVCVVYGGESYDLGDYELRFDPIGASSIEVYCLRRVKVNDHIYGGSGGYFCFGSRSSQISEHLSRGEYLAALSLAIEALHYVNAGDRRMIPDRYKQVRRTPDDHKWTR